MNGEQPGKTVTQPVDVRTRFERFPASIKGAFVLRGADGNPHSARFVHAVVARIPSGPKKPVPMEDRMLDIAPGRDLFVPFEVAVSELEPSWYAIESVLQVDGWRTWEYSGRPFTIPWPRTDVRRGTVTVGRPVTVEGSEFVVERVEFGSDRTAVVWRPRPVGSGKKREPGGDQGADGETAGQPEGEAIVVVDGQRIEILPQAARTSSASARLAPGERSTILYPVPRSARSMEVRVRISANVESEPLNVSLL
jgi:hypothetical protein